MELSYEHLPHNLKPSFLYFARLPEDAEISTKELTRFWIAQGFLEKDGIRSAEEIAEMYLSDLINRSLVMTAERRSAGGPKTCKIHDLLHDICIKKADEENFLKSTNLFSTYNKHQHLCIPTSSNINWRPFGHHCRSFRGHAKQSSCFRTMPLLKAVSLLPEEKVSSFGPTRVDVPCQLRYLGIISTLIPEGMLDNLLNLEVLSVTAGYVKVVVPYVVLKMVKLRHLSVRKKAVFEAECCNFSGTTNLRSISDVLIREKRDEEMLKKSPHLQTLKCTIDGGTTFPDLSSLAELESLRINFIFNDTIGAGVEIKFPWTIKKLRLDSCKLPWEKMSIIGELPNLQVLKLCNAFVGEEWETKDDQFQELRFLLIHWFPDLKQWSADSTHFPRLEQLVLSRCEILAEIPSDLGYIPTLQRIEVGYKCSKEAGLSAVEIEQEQHEFGNQELQVHIIHKYWTKEELMRELETESMREDTE